MKNYELYEVHNCQVYPYIIFSTSYISPLEKLDEIEQELKEKYAGKVIFDLLLSNGVSSNRYLEADFNGLQFDFNSFKPVSDLKEDLKEETGEFYYKNQTLLANSILSNAQQFLVRKGKI